MLTFSSNFFKAEILVLVLHFSKAPIKIAKISIADFSMYSKKILVGLSFYFKVSKMKLFGLFG